MALSRHRARAQAPDGVRHVVARRDPALAARIVGGLPLRYREGADPELDRPAHVRAASGLTRVAGRLVVVQDDANFLAVVDPVTGAADALPLPRGAGGSRLFDDDRGNKRFKLDLEACVTLDTAHGETLIAFGSGATSLRESVVLAGGWEGSSPRVELVHVPELYAGLRAAAAFAGGELNVEAAALVARCVRLFNRGNGRPRGADPPVSATCDLDAVELLRHLRDPGRVPAPHPSSIVQVQLGELEGVRLGFTGAAAAGDSVVFSAVAEDSPDATTDGPVTGAVLGVSDPDGGVRWAPLTVGGVPFTAKVEGLELEAGYKRALVVIDRDDPRAAGELCFVELHGPWLRATPAQSGLPSAVLDP